LFRKDSCGRPQSSRRHLYRQRHQPRRTRWFERCGGTCMVRTRRSGRRRQSSCSAGRVGRLALPFPGVAARRPRRQLDLSRSSRRSRGPAEESRWTPARAATTGTRGFRRNRRRQRSPSVGRGRRWRSPGRGGNRGAARAQGGALRKAGGTAKGRAGSARDRARATNSRRSADRRSEEWQRPAAGSSRRRRRPGFRSSRPSSGSAAPPAAARRTGPILGCANPRPGGCLVGLSRERRSRLGKGAVRPPPSRNEPPVRR
jgi:hypothetical protein